MQTKTDPIPLPPSQTNEILASAEKILKSFNTWSFKREQPSDTELMLRFISNALEKRRPIPFVLYWGKGLRSHIVDAERLCLAFLDRMSQRIAAVYSPGAKIHLLFTDTHAALNGHDQSSIDAYFSEVEQAMPSPTFVSSRLSDVVAKFTYDIPTETHAISDKLLAKLEKSAQKWYKNESHYRKGAEEYYWQNMIERKAVEQEFSSYIFLTFNGSDMRELFPSALPIFYMYSIRKGTSSKPWFMDC